MLPHSTSQERITHLNKLSLEESGKMVETAQLKRLTQQYSTLIGCYNNKKIEGENFHVLVEKFHGAFVATYIATHLHIKISQSADIN